MSQGDWDLHHSSLFNSIVFMTNPVLTSFSLTSKQSTGHFIFLRHTEFPVAIVTWITLAPERPNGVVARGLHVTQMTVLYSYVIGGVRYFIILVLKAFVGICTHKKGIAFHFTEEKRDPCSHFMRKSTKIFVKFSTKIVAGENSLLYKACKLRD